MRNSHTAENIAISPRDDFDAEQAAHLMTQKVLPETLIAKAVEAAGTSDFGPEGWREGLARSLDAFARIPLKHEVYAASVDKLVHDLTVRLRIEQWFKDHPETADQQIEGPVFVIGLPRTGTTATVGMLALDERFRFMRAWEGSAPLPPPIAGQEDADPRLIAARAAACSYDKAHVHLFDPDGPEEDLACLAGLDMHSYHGAYPMPDDYIDWWLNADFTSFYSYHRRVLQLLQSRRSPHLWLLKSPPHLFRLREIAHEYPDAKFVMTHRDPVKVIASVSSLHAMLYAERCPPGVIDRLKIGPLHLKLWAEGMQRGRAARAEIGEHRFIDVKNNDVVQRPLEVFEQIYNFIGIPVTPELSLELQQYNSRNAPGKFGEHTYTPEEYGLSAQQIHTAFATYIDRFTL